MKPTEWMRSAEGAVYHLNLMPEQLAETILLVGDPGRVEMVSRHFDRIDYRVRHREFVTHTGWMGSLHLSVVSTGIGTDNVDIVLNELDSLHNLDFVSETSVSAPKSLRLIRLGTSGVLQADLEVGSLLCTSLALGLDGLLPFYDLGSDPGFDSWVAALLDAHPALKKMAIPTFNPAHPGLLQQLSLDLPTGITLTCAGFYAPQGRSLRLKPAFDDLIDPLSRFRFPDGSGITNMEMETSGLYGLSRLMGHQAVSVNAILANRSTGERCSDPERAIKQMIQTVLGRLL